MSLKIPRQHSSSISLPKLDCKTTRMSAYASFQPTLRMPQHSMNCDYGPMYYPHRNYGMTADDMDATRMSCPNTYQRLESIVPFETAMERLYTTLTESVSFFKELDSSFEEETRSIRPYVTAAVMEDLWKCKLAVVEAGLPETQGKQPLSHSKHRTSSCASWSKRDHDVASKIGLQPAAAARTSFKAYLQRLDNDLLDALYCRWPFGHLNRCERTLSCMDAGSLSRLHDKIQVQDQALRQITSNVYRLQSCLKEVIQECDMLLIYMKNTKALWQSQTQERGIEPVFLSWR